MHPAKVAEIWNPSIESNSCRKDKSQNDTSKICSLIKFIMFKCKSGVQTPISHIPVARRKPPCKSITCGMPWYCRILLRLGRIPSSGINISGRNAVAAIGYLPFQRSTRSATRAANAAWLGFQEIALEISNQKSKSVTKQSVKVKPKAEINLFIAVLNAGVVFF